MKVYIFKVRDYSTVLVGQKFGKKGAFSSGFYVQRGDGTKYKYEKYRIEWSRRVFLGARKMI